MKQAHDVPAPCPLIPRSRTAQRLLTGSAVGLVLACLPLTPVRGEEAPVEIPAISVEADSPGAGYKPSGVRSRKYTKPLVDTPQTITVINQQLIEDRGAQSLTEVLRTTPGISLGAGEGGTPLGDRAFIRGFDARTDTFVDGARDFGGYFRDPFNYEQIEVAKGPGSAYAGRGSTGGTINLVTKAPHLGSFYDGSLGLDSELSTRAAIDINQTLAPAGIANSAIRLNAVVHDGEVAGRDEVDYTRWGIAPSLSFGIGTPTQLTFQYMHFENDSLPDYGHPFNPATGAPIDVDRSNFYGLKDRDQDATVTDIGTIQLSHDFTDWISISNQFRYGRTSKDFIVTKPEYTSGDPTVYRSDRSRDSIDTILTNQTNLLAFFDTGPLSHGLTTGVELTRETSSNRSRSIDDAIPASFHNPDPDTPYLGMIVPAANAAESTTDGIAAYLFDTIDVTDWLQLNGGIRWDGFSTDYTNASSEEFERSDSVISYRAGVLVKPLPNGSIYFSFGTSTNPSSEGLTLSDSTEQLEPEQSISFELGTKWELFDDRLLLSAAVFRTDKTNARTSTGGGAPQVLDGRQRVQGFEIGIAGNITEDWSLSGGYVFLDSEILETAVADQVGNEFQNIPHHSFSLWTSYQVTEEVSLGGGVIFQSMRYANNANDRRLPAYHRFDAMAAYQVTENVELQLNVLNLTNETYYDSTHAGQHALLGPGRTILVSANLHF